ncbi:hypothetical protein FRA_50c15330 [Francisella sp. W12-1067]|nr:hypothetical protein FRA_50c15330 [Francisella sp. W12-1067]
MAKKIHERIKSNLGYAFLGADRKGVCFGSVVTFFHETIVNNNYFLKSDGVHISLVRSEALQMKFQKKNFDVDAILEEQFLQRIKISEDQVYKPSKFLNEIYSRYSNSHVGGYLLELTGDNSGHAVAFFITRDNKLLYLNSNYGLYLLDDVENDLKDLKTNFFDIKKNKYDLYSLYHVIETPKNFFN